MKTLNELLELKPKVIYPGHGPEILNPEEIIRYYIKHRNDREQQIVQFLKNNNGKKVTALDIVKGVYKVRLINITLKFVLKNTFIVSYSLKNI